MKQVFPFHTLQHFRFTATFGICAARITAVRYKLHWYVSLSCEHCSDSVEDMQFLTQVIHIWCGLPGPLSVCPSEQVYAISLYYLSAFLLINRSMHPCARTHTAPSISTVMLMQNETSNKQGQEWNTVNEVSNEYTPPSKLDKGHHVFCMWLLPDMMGFKSFLLNFIDVWSTWALKIMKPSLNHWRVTNWPTYWPCFDSY